MPHQEDYFTSRDGLRLLHRSWLPDTEAAAAVAVLHGFIEHSGRHARLAGELNARGYAVHAMDLRGHGKSAGPRCFIRSFDEYLDDLDVFVRLVTEQEPGKPLFVFGYSMGGTIGLLWAIRRLAGGDGQEAGKMPALPVRGLIVVGPGIRIGPGVFPIMRRLVWLVSRVFPRLRLVRLRGGGISRDPLVVAGFQNDPLVFHGRIPVRTGAEILRAADRVTGELESVRLPLLILHGTVDRVCDCEGSRQLYLRAASTDKTLRLYDGLYHEILSEPERRQVLDDLLNWLDARRG